MISDICKEIEQIEEAKDRLRAQQDAVLDFFDKNNPAHKALLIEISSLLEEFEDLSKRYSEILDSAA